MKQQIADAVRCFIGAPPNLCILESFKTALNLWEVVFGKQVSRLANELRRDASNDGRTHFAIGQASAIRKIELKKSRAGHHDPVARHVADVTLPCRRPNLSVEVCVSLCDALVWPFHRA